MPQGLDKRNKKRHGWTDSVSKHKYITQPEITNTDALLKASSNLCDTLQNAASESSAMEVAVKALMKIFKGKAAMDATKIDRRRERRKEAQRQRVFPNEEEAEAQRVADNKVATQRVAKEGANPQKAEETPQSDLEEEGGLQMPGLEVTYLELEEADAPPVVSQDDNGPSQNTRTGRHQQL